MVAAQDERTDFFASLLLGFSFFFLVLSFAILAFTLNLYFQGCVCSLKSLTWQSSSVGGKGEEKKRADDISILENAEDKHWQQAMQRAEKWDKAAQLVYFSIVYQPQKDKIPLVFYKFYSPEKENALGLTWTSEGKMKMEDEEVVDKIEFLSFPPPLTAQKAVQLALADLRKTGVNKTISFVVVATKAKFDYWHIKFTIQETPSREKDYIYHVFYDEMVEFQGNY